MAPFHLFVLPTSALWLDKSICMSRYGNLSVDFNINALLILLYFLQTPTRSSFKKSFAVLHNWLPLSGVDSKLKVMPSVQAVILRCIKENNFWPIDELMVLVDSRVVTSRWDINNFIRCFGERCRLSFYSL